ncbi:hypothetical protein ACFLZP_03660 [Patescibacteria group bacterium]
MSQAERGQPGGEDSGVVAFIGPYSFFDSDEAQGQRDETLREAETVLPAHGLRAQRPRPRLGGSRVIVVRRPTTQPGG